MKRTLFGSLQITVLLAITFTVHQVLRSEREHTNDIYMSPKYAIGDHFTSISSTFRNGNYFQNISMWELKLTPLKKTDNWPIMPIFFTVTNEATTLNGRQWCAIESAFRLPFLHPVLLMSSSTVQLHSALFDLFKNGKFSVYQFEQEPYFKSTPLEPIYKNVTSIENPNRMEQFSDLIRAVVIYNHGGMYADLDYVFTNRFLSQQNAFFCMSLFALEKHSKYLELVMEYQAKHWSPKVYGSVGPLSFEPVLFNQLNGSSNNLGIVVYRRKGLFTENYAGDLWANEPKDDKYWKDRVHTRPAVHLFNKLTAGNPINKTDRKSAFSYFGPAFCPVSWKNTNF